MKSKRGYEFSFGWIFAVMIGAVILFLAIYISTQIIGFQRFESESKTAKQLSILLNPIATNLEEAKFAIIIVPDETKIFNECNPSGSFGSQGISTSVKQGSVGEAWPEGRGVESTFHDRYLFSDREEHAEKEFYILSKPFEYPFKIADIMVLWNDGEDFCFVHPTPDIIEEIDDLKLNEHNIEYVTTSSPADCTPGTKKVCFFETGTSGCHITVGNYKVTHLDSNGNNEELYYIRLSNSREPNALLYGAIFSDPDLYKCQLRRLMKRASILSDLYIEKINNLRKQGCNFGSLESMLLDYKQLVAGVARTGNFNDLIDPAVNFETDVQQLKWENDQLVHCRLF